MPGQVQGKLHSEAVSHRAISLGGSSKRRLDEGWLGYAAFTGRGELSQS